ncbi:chemotaxis response regulator protein-glutamate methylesterase [Candidatus Woesearchaeota archaeon]|nr:chemotaxis response regulator protein-glutamate methylesterase [Candidatus Woesearchaeota archaeon]
MALKIVVADDSALMRKVIADILRTDPELEIVGIAKNGEEAIRLVKEKSPDVLTLDMNMPDKNGIDVIKEVMKENQTPILVISALTQEGSKSTMEALAAGAIDFIAKPSGEISVNLTDLKDDIIKKVKVVGAAQVKKMEIKGKKAARQAFNPTRKKVILIGASTGGPQTIEAILTQLPRNIPAPILVVQHMPGGEFTKMFADRLKRLCEIDVREAQQGDELKDGLALIAPGGMHMKLEAEVEGAEGTIQLTLDPPELGVRPCVNHLFRSASNIFKENTIGVILTGMGSDGKEGCRIIKDLHGTVLAEAAESCIVFGMPKEVINANLADEILTLEKIPVALLQLMEI